MRTQKARFAMMAALFGIASPVGWLAGLVTCIIYTILLQSVEHSNDDRTLSIGLVIIALFTFVPPAIAVLAGRAARNRIIQSNGSLGGNAHAWIGLILGYGTLIILAALIASFTLLNLIYPERMHQYVKEKLEHADRGYP